MGSAIASLTGKSAPATPSSAKGAIGALISAGPAYRAQLASTAQSKPVDPNTLGDTKALNAALQNKQITQQQFADRYNKIVNKSTYTKPASLVEAIKRFGASATKDTVTDYVVNPIKAAGVDTAKQSVKLGKQILARPASAEERQSIITNQTAAATNKEYTQATKGLEKLNNTVEGPIQAQRMAARGAKASEIRAFLLQDAAKLDEQTKKGINAASVATSVNVGEGIAAKTLGKAISLARGGAKTATEDIARSGVPTARSAFDKQLAVSQAESGAKTAPTASKSLTRADAAAGSPSATLEAPLGTPKNPTIPSIESPTSIPKERKLTRDLISVSGELSREGKSGKDIADRLAKAESSSEVGQAQFLHKIPSVTKLSNKDFPKFVDTLEALDKGKPPKVIPPHIQQAVDEWSKAIPEVRTRGEKAGIDVGDLGKYYFPRNYTEALGTKKGLTDAAQHLVKTGQAKDFGAAVAQLRFTKNEYARPFGHFERSRTLDLPNYDKSKNALVNYVSGAFNKVGHAEQFGAKGEVAHTLIGNIAAEGRNADRAQRNYEIATGNYAKHQPGEHDIPGKIRAAQRVTKLGLSSVLNATQSVNTAAKTGIVRTATAALKQMRKADRDYVEQTGVRVESVINALREQTGGASKLAKSGNFVKKVLGKALDAPGFGAVEKFNRGVAAVAGRDWADSLAAKGSPQAIKVLREKLGVEGEIGKKLTQEQQIQASRKIVELTQFKTGAKDLPGWTDSPMGKTVAQFRTFSYKQTGFVYNELLKEAVKGNPVPLMRFIAVGVPIGITAGGIRNKLGGKPFYGDTKGQDELHKLLGATFTGSSNVGGTGLAGSAIFLAQNRKSKNLPSYVAGDVGGPTVGLGASVIQASGNKTAQKRLALGQVPVAGPYLKTKYTPYGSAQQRSFDKAADEKVAKALVQSKYSPSDPSDARSKALKTSNPKQYQQELDKSNELFTKKIAHYLSTDYKTDSPDTRKKTLSKALSEARKKTLDDMHVKKPAKSKSSKVKSYSP